MPVEVQIVVWAAILLFGGWIFLQARAEAEKIDRRQKKLCRNCGYDLRASSGICPECGVAIVVIDVTIAPLDKDKLCNDWPSTPITPRQPGIEETSVVLHRTDNSHEANLLKDQLTMRGIASEVQKSDATRSVSAALYQMAPGETHVVAVWSADEAEAKAYIATLVKPGELTNKGQS